MCWPDSFRCMRLDLIEILSLHMPGSRRVRPHLPAMLSLRRFFLDDNERDARAPVEPIGVLKLPARFHFMCLTLRKTHWHILHITGALKALALVGLVVRDLPMFPVSFS